jgi:hypothetical protein
VTLADQDRTRWNRAAIAEGSAWLSEAVARSGWVAGPYQIQAHLAAAHSSAPSWQETDWDRIVGLYDLLGSITADPVVALNRAVAVTERDGPKAGLAALKTTVGLEYSHLWHAALADNLRRLGPHERGGRRTSHRGDPGAQRSRTAPPAWPSAHRAVRARLTAFLAFSLSPTFPTFSLASAVPSGLTRTVQGSPALWLAGTRALTV